MALITDHKIEITKIIIGVLMTSVAAWWTYTTYYEDERKHELETLINLGNAIAGMHVSCKGSFGELAELASAAKASRQGRCYEYFQDAHRISLTAPITVKKPYWLSAQQWITYWDNLQNVIAATGSQEYEFNSVQNAWVDILIAKNLKEPVEENEL